MTGSRGGGTITENSRLAWKPGLEYLDYSLTWLVSVCCRIYLEDNKSAPVECRESHGSRGPKSDCYRAKRRSCHTGIRPFCSAVVDTQDNAYSEIPVVCDAPRWMATPACMKASGQVLTNLEEQLARPCSTVELIRTIRAIRLSGLIVGLIVLTEYCRRHSRRIPWAGRRVGPAAFIPQRSCGRLAAGFSR